MKGFFAIGAENISKSQNLGNLFRSANAFGASFTFTINADFQLSQAKLVDTSKSYRNLPLYNFDSIHDMPIPVGTKLVAVELMDNSENLPNFYHPKQAIYILGPEKGRVSDEVLKKCDYCVKIPTKFCINVAMAGALVMYDRILSLGGEVERKPSLPLNFADFKTYEAPEDHMN